MCRLRSSGTPEGKQEAAKLLSRMAEVPANHAAVLDGQAVSQLLETLPRADLAAQESAVKGLASIAVTPVKLAGGSPSPLILPRMTLRRTLPTDPGSPRLGLISVETSTAGGCPRNTT